MSLRLLDAFSGAGGAGEGYRRAGFTVSGVDIRPQPRYLPGEFVLSDALQFIREHAHEFDAIHASPPCQRYSDLAKRNGNADDHPDLVAPVRELLLATGKPFVIENVEGAPLRRDLLLCGTQFAELRVIRHRVFETSFPVPRLPCDTHPLVFTYDKRKAHYGKLDQNTSYVQVTGGGNCTVANARDAMGISWMTKSEINEAIPPAYTHYIGLYLREQVIR